MTRHVEPEGPSNLSYRSLPVRSTVAAFSPVRNNNDSIRNAVLAGKNISGLLADTLMQSTLANNEESNLHGILTLAEELHNYQSPVEFTIGLVGDSGVGKSSLINSLLDHKKLARTASTGRACTTVVTEYRKKREGDAEVYTIEIECMDNREIEDLLRQSVVDYRRYHLRDAGSVESHEEEQLRIKAAAGWDTLKTAFEDREGCSEILFRNEGVDTNYIQQLVFGWKDDIIWPANFNAQNTVLRAQDVEGCARQVDDFLSARVWPFVKVVRIYLDATVLNNGVVLVDLPGFRDVNTARVRITETRLYQCDEIFVVTEIGRASTNVGVENLVVQQLGNNFDGLRRSQGVTIVCTKSDVDSAQRSEILRDVPNTNAFNPRIAQELSNQIEEAEDNGRPLWYLEAKRDHLFITARNEHVKRQLMIHYAAQARTRIIDVFCVSNESYVKADEQRSRIEQNRRWTNIMERSLAMNQLLTNSGICELRDFCEKIPSRSQIIETRHFLNTRLVTLLEKTDLWLTASVAGVAANQQGTPALLGELQTELTATFAESVTNSNEGLGDGKMGLLQQPFTQGMNRWEQGALTVVRDLERWHAASLSAFWNHEGAHATTAQGYRNWNVDMIRVMVEEFQPSEDLFRSRSEALFETLKVSIHEGLSVLLMRLGDLNGVEVFTETFPRRRRNLDYDIINITTSFFDEVQIVFHELLRTHGTSYVMCHMLPMYNTIERGPGMKQRLLERLRSHVVGDRHSPGLFKAIRDLFLSAMDSLLAVTNEKLQTATDRSCEDIKNDLELLMGEEVPAEEQDGVLETMFTILEQARNTRDEAQGRFEAELVEH